MFKKLKKLDYRYYIGIVIVAIALVFGVIYIFRAPQSAEAEWFNDSWYYRQSISITNSSSAVTNIRFKVLSGVDLSSLVSAGKLQSDLDDLRFTDIDGNLLKYWIEDDTNSSVDIWVLLPSLADGGSTIYMYYGNSSANAGSDSSALPASCSEVNSFLGDGIYYIDADGSGSNDPFQVYCDMSTESGGWTEILNLDTNDGTDHWWGDTTYWQGTGTEGSTANSLTSGYKSQAFTDIDSFSEIMIFMHTEGVEVAYGVYDVLEDYQTSSFYDLFNLPNSDAGTIITGTQQHQSGASGSPLNTERSQTRYGDEFVDSFNTEAIVVNRVKRFNTDGINYMRLATDFNNSDYSHTFSGLGIHHERPTGSYISKMEAAPITAYCGNVPYYGTDRTLGGFLCGNNTSYDRDMAIFVREFSATSTNVAVNSPSSEEKGPGPIAYWSFDEGHGTTTQDRTSNSNDGTITGATWQTEDQCIAGKCLYFDGDGDYIELSDFTVERAGGSVCFWYKSLGDYTSNYGGRGTVISDKNEYAYLIALRSNDEVYRWESESNTNGDFLLLTDYIYNKNEWHQLCMVMDSNDVYSYLDGQLIDTETAEDDVTFEIIGAGDYNNADSTRRQFFHGYLDEIKVYDYARTEAQIKSDYNAGLAGVSSNSGINVAMGGRSNKSLSDGLVGYWKMDESSWSGVADEVVDSSGNENHGVAVNGASTTSTAKYAMAGEFNGGNSYVDMGDPDEYDFGANDFTISAWAYRNTGFGSYDTSIVTKWNTGASPGTNEFSFSHGSGSSDTYPGFGIESGNTTYSAVSGEITNNDEWYHLVGMRKGEYIYIFVNGEEKDSEYVGSVSVNNISGRTLKLAKIDGGNYGLNGYIDEVRIYNRALSSREVKQLYEYAPGPIGYWDFEEKSGTTAYDKSGNENNGTLTNMDASTDWVLGKYGSALDFDNIDDGVLLDSTIALDDTVNWTVNAWIKTVASGEESVLSNSSGGPVTSSFGINISKIMYRHYDGTWKYKYGTSNIADNNWHFLTWVNHSDQTIDLYVDGIIEASRVASVLTNDGPVNQIGKFVNSTFNGSIDEVKIYNYARTQKQILEDMNGGRPASKSPFIYLKFNEGYGNTTHNLGSSNIDSTLCNSISWTSDGKVGKALNFDGLNDYTTLSDNDLFNYIGEDKTFSFWMKADSGESVGYVISKPWNGGGEYNYNFQWNGSGLSFRLDGTGGSQYLATNITMNTETWYHVVLTIDSETKMRTFYINGVKDNSGAHTITAWTPDSGDSNYPFIVGTLYAYNCSSWAGNTGHAFDGIIDEVKIFNYPLTEDEVKQEYNQGKAIVIGSEKNTSSTWDDGGFGGNPPVASWNFEEGSGTTANDVSGNGNTGTLNTMDNSDWVLGKESSWALDFDGSSDYIDVGQIDLDHTEPLSISVWVNVPSPIPTNPMIFGKTSDSGSYRGFHFNVGTDGKLAAGYFETHTPSSIRTSAKTQASIDTDRWTHIELTYDGSNDYTGFNFYIDGILQDKTDEDSGSVTNSTTSNNAYIGARAWGTGNNFLGKIDEFKIYDYVRTPDQVAWDYNGGKPIAHWRLDDGEGITANDASGNGNNGTLTNMDPATDWLDGSDCKFEGCLDFDGSDDHITTDVVRSDLGDYYSISVWFKYDGSSSRGYTPIIGSYDGGAGTEFFIGKNSGNTNIGVQDGTYQGSLVTGSDAFDGNWHNIIFIFNNGTGSLYLDGVFKNSDSFTGTNDAEQIYIGYETEGAGYYWLGQIDDVRFYNYNLGTDQIKEIYNGGVMRFE